MNTWINDDVGLTITVRDCGKIMLQTHEDWVLMTPDEAREIALRLCPALAKVESAPRDCTRENNKGTLED
jgi:hypothetical protein